MLITSFKVIDGDDDDGGGGVFWPRNTRLNIRWRNKHKTNVTRPLKCPFVSIGH